jgi:hypothetical protein
VDNGLLVFLCPVIEIKYKFFFFNLDEVFHFFLSAHNDIEALKHPGYFLLKIKKKSYLDFFPQDLKLIAASLQSLSKGTARVLLTYTRISRTRL